jgi:predicted transcriptional regulator
MPTENPRLQVMLDHETQGLLARLAAAQHRSMSAIAADLIRDALDIQEDHLLSRHGDARLAATQNWVSHDAAWS